MFIELVLEELKKKKITQKQLCDEAGIKEQTFTNWKKGNIPNLESAMIVIKYLGLSADEMYGIKNYELTEDEKELIILYRQTDEKSREIIKATARAAAFSKSSDSNKTDIG